jgi:hypothetical protein
MRHLVCAALLCASISANADSLIARQGSDSIRIYNKPCHAEVIAAVPEAKDMGAAIAMVGGKQYKACWQHRGPVIFLRYEDKDMGSVPVEMFKEDVSI